MYALIGAKKKADLLCVKEIKKMGFKTLVATDDGSQGKKGFVTELLKDLLSASATKIGGSASGGIRYPLNANIYACGPASMLKAVSKIAASHNIPCQVSLEERMACGVGVCLGCPVKIKANHPAVGTQSSIRNTQYEYKMVCKDGPVFDAKDIIW